MVSSLQLFFSTGAHLALAVAQATQTCTTSDAGNTIASNFLNDVSGAVNATYAIVPIDYSLARSIIPSEYKILDSQIKKALPTLPEGTFPLVVESDMYHDIRYGVILNATQDFQAFHWGFPFIDRLGDGVSPFNYEPGIFMSYDPVAQASELKYGKVVSQATFDPPCEPYAFAPTSAGYGKNSKTGDIYFKACLANATLCGSTGAKPVVSLSYSQLPDGDIGPYPLEFYLQYVQMPIFSSTTLCDKETRYMNTSLTQGTGRLPVGLRGSVKLPGSIILPETTIFDHVFGVKFDSAWLKYDFINCTEFTADQTTYPTTYNTS